MAISTETIKRNLEKSIQAGMSAWADTVVANIQRLAHKKSGHMAASVSHGPVGKDGAVKFIVDCPYAVDQEFGTVNMEPHPFVRPEISRIRHEGAAEISAYVKRNMGG